MIQIKIEDDGRVQSVKCSSEPLDSFVQVESVPEAHQIDGKIPVMYYRNGAIAYEYVDIPPVPEEPEPIPEPAPDYNETVDGLIRQRYSLSEELAILRQRDTKPDEFAVYNAFAEECKVQARGIIRQEGVR